MNVGRRLIKENGISPHGERIKHFYRNHLIDTFYSLILIFAL